MVETNARECPKCNAVVTGMRCTICGEEVAVGDKMKEREERWDEQRMVDQKESDFVERYREVQKNLNLNGLELGRFLAFRRLPGTHFMGIRKLGVQTGWQAVVYSEHGDTLMTLPPGVYPVSAKQVNPNRFAGFMDSFQGTSLSIFLVRSTEIPITFVVPEDEGVYHEMSVCNIRSAEGFMGGALATLVVRIIDPTLLLQMFRQNFEAVAEEVKTPRSLEVLGAPFSYLKHLLSPDKPDLSTTPSKSEKGEQEPLKTKIPITADHLWKYIRHEFVQVVGATTINETADEMRNSAEVRERVRQRIDAGMEGTLRRYGLDIAQVTAFQFLSPEHDRILQKAADAGREQAELESEEQMAEVRRRRRRIAEKDATDKAEADKNIEVGEVDAQAEVDRKRIKEDEDVTLRRTEADAHVAKAQDQAKAESTQREMSMDAQRQDHTRAQDALNRDHARTQLEADERQQTQLQVEKARQFLELKNAQENAAMQRRIEYMKAVAEAGLPSDSILALQLAEHPELAHAYAEAVRARGYEERIALQHHFEREILAIGVQDKKNVQRLLEEGIKQAGNVMTEHQRRHRPQIAVTGMGVQRIETRDGDEGSPEDSDDAGEAQEEGPSEDREE